MRRVQRLTTTGLVTLGVLAGGLLLSAAPALAAPEKPVTEAAEEITATTATLHGELNPGAEAKAGWYFAYSTEPTCTGSFTTAQKPEAEVHAQAREKEVTELQPNKKYEFCLVATNELSETTPGIGVPFTTLPAPPELVPSSEKTSLVTTTAATLEAQVNPNNQATTYAFEYATEEAAIGTPRATTINGLSSPLAAEFGDQLASVDLTGLQLGTSYYYRVVAKNGTPPTTEGTIEHFTTLGIAPLVSTGAVSEIGQSSANVTGTVNPEGAETYYYYQYGPSTEYGQSTMPEGPGVSVGAGLSAVEAPAILVPLTPGVAYHYRLVAWNEDGTSYGQDETFTTSAGQSPLASTGAASGVTVDEATISGTVNPQGKETSYRFEYGEGTEYGTQVFGTILAGQGVETVTLNLRGIDPDTTYHYRLVASNAGGTAYGEDVTFTTPGILDPLVSPAVAPLIATPALAFPKEEKASGTTTKTLTNAEKLKKALKACHAKKGKKRAGCEATARKRYAPVKQKGKKK
jgi:hypothetical protein